MATYTQGKWLVADLGDCITIGNLENGAICRIKNEVSGRPINDEDRANAALIANAPIRSRQLAEAVRALETLATEPGCGCSFPCQCDNKEQLREELNGRMDRANSALKLIRDIGEGTV